MDIDVGRTKDDEFRENCAKHLSLISQQADYKNLFIFGAGKGGEILASILKQNNILIKGFVEDRKDIKSYLGYSVIASNQLNCDTDFVVLSLMDWNNEIINQLLSLGFSSKDFLCLAKYNTEYNEEDIYYRGCRIGKYTYGYDTLMQYYPYAKEIGRYCSINRTAKIWNNHPVEYLSTHSFLDNPAFWDWEEYDQRKELIDKYGIYTNNADYGGSALRKNLTIYIGHDVWIGANVIILPGVKIGNGAVIAAGAVVTKDVGAYEIVGGVPAKKIRLRFAMNEIEILEKVQWWNWSAEEIKRNMEFFYNPAMFFEKYKNEGKDRD